MGQSVSNSGVTGVKIIIFVSRRLNSSITHECCTRLWLWRWVMAMARDRNLGGKGEGYGDRSLRASSKFTHKAESP